MQQVMGMKVGSDWRKGLQKSHVNVDGMVLKVWAVLDLARLSEMKYKEIV